jgi:hypothetical protein
MSISAISGDPVVVAFQQSGIGDQESDPRGVVFAPITDSRYRSFSIVGRKGLEWGSIGPRDAIEDGSLHRGLRAHARHHSAMPGYSFHIRPSFRASTRKLYRIAAHAFEKLSRAN